MSPTFLTRFCVLLVLLLVAPRVAQAQADFSTLTVKAGDVVHVMQVSGIEISGPITQLTPTLLAIDGHEFTPATTLRIDRKGDSLRSGATIGAAVWGGLCVLTCAIALQGGELAAAVATNAGIGALVGMLIDASHTGRTTIYRGAPTVVQVVPVVTRERRALSVRVTF